MTPNIIKVLRQGSSIKNNKKICEIEGRGLNGFKYKNNLTLDVGNSATAARLLIATLIRSKKTIKVTGDNSLKKRDMKRIIEPLNNFGVKFKKNSGTLPIWIKGSDSLKPINYVELRGSAQCKSAVMIAALNIKGKTTEKLGFKNEDDLMFKNILIIPIKIKKQKKFDLIEININPSEISYKIPGDISSASFFIVLTLLSKNSNLLIKDININPTRTGIISILNMMGAKIKFINKKIIKEKKFLIFLSKI